MENVVISNAKEGNLKAAEFYLKSKGISRGYSFVKTNEVAEEIPETIIIEDLTPKEEIKQLK